jgi:hypothetical protein
VQAFDALPVSVRTTYDAVTHALLTTKLTDADGASLGTALDRVASLETIRGSVKGGRGDVQFRLYALLESNTFKILKKSQEFRRTADNTVFHKGYPISFRQQGGVPSIQFSISRDGRRADVDVDYRSSKFPAAVLNGHLTAANSDVRAGGNFGRHVGRWLGLNKWWKSLFDFDLIRDLRESAAEDDGQTIPAVPRAGKAKLPDAVADFLSALFVEGAANEAVAYLSEELYWCWELKGLTDGEPLNRGLAPYTALRQYQDIHRELTKLLGEITDLKQVIRGVRLTGYPGLRVINQPYHDRFVLYDIPEGGALEWACSSRLTGEAPLKKDSKRYGKYFLAVFRVPPESKGATVGLLLAKKRGHWKVVAYDDEADVDYSSVPDLRATDREGRALKTVGADTTLLRAVRRFHRDWFLGRNYAGALQFFSPDIFSCRKLYLSEGDKPAEDFQEMLAGWHEGMRRTLEQLGIHKQLAGAIRSVTPTTNDLAVVNHPDQEAFTIFALSDELGEAADCANRQTGNQQVSEELLRAPAEGNYYAASFETEVAGGNPGALTTFWRKADEGWRIYAYRVDTP